MNYSSLELYIGLFMTLPQAQGLTYAAIGRKLHVSPSSVHQALEQGNRAGWVQTGRGKEVDTNFAREISKHQMNPAIFWPIVEVARYLFPSVRGPVVRGIPTSLGAPPLSANFPGINPLPVWPSPLGTVRGYAIEPLANAVTKAVAGNKELYELLALVDAWREGGLREANLAKELLRKQILGDSA